MSAPSPGQPVPDPAAGIHDLERFLAAKSGRTAARQSPGALADRTPHLTAAERRRDVTLAARERRTGHGGLRAEPARGETPAARDRLRRRCLTVAWLLGAACAALCLVTFLTIVSL